MKQVYHGYIVFASTFVLSVVSIGVFNACSLFLDSLTTTFQDDSLALTLLPFWITTQVVVGLAASMGGGPVQDWLSEVAKISMEWQFVIFGGGLLCGGFFLSSIATNIWVLLLGSILLGIGIGFNGFISAAICVLWFDANRGTMLLLALSGRGLGSMLSSLIIAKLLAAHDDDGAGEDPWRPVMRIVGLACLIIGAIASLGMRLPMPGEVEAHETGIALEEAWLEGDDEKDALVQDYNEEEKKTGSYGSLKNGGTPSASPGPPTPRTGGGRGRMARPSTAALRPSTAYSGVGGGRRSSVTVIAQMRKTRRSSIANATRMAGQSIVGRKSRLSILPTGRNLRKSSVAEFNALSFAPVDFTMEDDEEFFKDEDIDKDAQLSFSQVLLSRTSVCLNLWSLISSFSFLNLQVYLPAYATSDLGLPSSVAGTAMTAFGLGLLLANLTLGPIADRVGANPMLFWSMMGLAVMDLLWPLCLNALSIESVAGVYGFFSATNGCLPLIIVADAFNNVPPNYILMLNGVLNVTKCPGFLVGPTLAALFQSDPNDYASIATVSWIVMAVGNAFLLLIPSPDDIDDDEDTLGELKPNSMIGANLDTIMDASESNRESYQSTASSKA